MPVTFIPDTVEGSSLKFDLGQVSKTRGGIVTGLTGDPSTAVEQCLFAVGMPALGTIKVINGVTVYFRNLQVTPISTDTCRVQLIYDAPSGTSQGYTITSRGYEQSIETDLIPGTRTPITVGPWTDPAGKAGPIDKDDAKIRYSRSIREVTVSGVRAGHPTYVLEEAVNYVNDAPWRGKDVGYWKITEGGVSESVYQGYYTYHISAVTQNDQDWSDIARLTNKKIGKSIPITPSEVAALNAPPYSFGIIATTPSKSAVRVGLYNTIGFPALFGF